MQVKKTLPFVKEVKGERVLWVGVAFFFFFLGENNFILVVF